MRNWDAGSVCRLDTALSASSPVLVSVQVPAVRGAWTPRGAQHFMVSGAPVMNGGGLAHGGEPPVSAC